jgi:hypothetical protein
MSSFPRKLRVPSSLAVRSTLRALLRTVSARTTVSPVAAASRVLWRTSVLDQYRANSGETDPVRRARMHQAAEEWVALQTSLDEHDGALKEAGWGLNISDDRRRQSVAARVGLQMPQLFSDAANVGLDGGNVAMSAVGDGVDAAAAATSAPK